MNLIDGFITTCESLMITEDEIVTESWVISGDDLVVNLNDWKRKKYQNILYVTGLSGSGKTTLAEKYEKEYNAEMFEFDGIEHNYDSSKSNILNKLKDKFPKYREIINKKSYKNLMTSDEMGKMYRFVIKEMHDNPNVLYILEGIQIFEYFDPKSLKNKPMIIKNSSTLKSILQRFKRNGDGKIEWEEELKNEFIELVSWYVNSTKRLNKFKKELK